MTRTKIVCTVGPACRDENTLTEMMRAGMNVARLNFSHGDHEFHRGTLEMLKNVREKLGLPLAIMLDTKGPEMRLGVFENGSAELKDAAEFTLSARETAGTAERAQISFAGLAKAVSPGTRLLVDDGRIELRVEKVRGDDICCRVVHGGTVSDRKSVNAPGTRLDIPALGEKDRNDLLFGIENDVDFVAASFVRSGKDVDALRKFLNYNGGHSIRIISKIENAEGIDNFSDILERSDGIMIARGDMGVEIEYERLPGIQKRFIRECYRRGKMVITATQMMESMINCPNPTRAEITDVANAVFDGTSAVMLSGETAAGRFPVRAVEAMARIANQAEKDMFDMGLYRLGGTDADSDAADMPNAICDAACRAARDIDAKAIIVVTKSGQTARGVSKFRPRQPIIAATPEIKTYNQLSLSWGVIPVLARYQKNSDDLLIHAIDCAKQVDVVADGDKVVIAAGLPLDTPGSTNLLKVVRV